MPLTDLPMPVMFLVFLMLFVLVGIYPAWKRAAAKIRAFLNRDPEYAGPGGATEKKGRPPIGERPQLTPTLNDFELFVFLRLSLAADQGLTSNQVIAGLHFEPTIVRQALASLCDRGLLAKARSIGCGCRYVLSPMGREFALARGYLPSIQVR